MPPATVLPEVLRATAGHQWGLLSTEQLIAHMTDSAVASLTRVGTLERLRRGVYRLAGAPASFRQRAMAEVLAYGPPVAISHGSAARLWGFAELGQGPIDVTLPPGRSGRRGGLVVIHRRLLFDGDVASRHRIAVTSPVRTLADLATGPWDARLLGRCIDDMLRKRLLTVGGLADGIAAMSRHPGGQALRRLADSHLEGLDACERPAGSGWEQEVRRWLRDAELPATVAQHPVEVGGRTLWLDMAMPEWCIAIEFDGYAFHSGRTSFDLDRRRWADLQLAGWLVILVTSRQTREEVVERVRRALARRQRQPEGT